MEFSTKKSQNRNLLSRCNHDSTDNLQLVQGTIQSDKSDNTNSMGNKVRYDDNGPCVYSQYKPTR